MTRHLLTLSLALALGACSNGFDDKGDDPEGDEDDSDTDTDTDTDADTDDDTDAGDDYTDDDGDGFTEDEGDCDDDNADVRPNAVEVCNGVDDDCNGEVDDDPSDGNTYYRDSDGDGYGTNAETIDACDLPGGYADNAEDCDDDVSTANPRGVEINWNGIDENCDGRDVDLEACVNEAVDDTAAYMADYWSVPDYTGSYRDPVIGSFDIADWTMANQWLYIVDNANTVTMSEGATSYNVYFDALMGMNSSTDGFWIDVSTSWLAELAGIDYDAYCDGYVTDTVMDVDGSLTLTVNGTAQTVSGASSLTYTRATLTQSDVNMSDPMTGGVCDIFIFDLIADAAGYGDTLGIIDESMETTAALLVTTYESVLEAYIDESCSAP
jgi:hypothetical protein